MDLFYRSDFYEEESNNEELRTQMVFQGYQERLRQMTGVQFVVSEFFPDRNLFWIQKRHRTSPTKHDVVSVYYALNFVIFQAPTLSHIVDTRINNSIFFQKKAFEVIQSASDILYTSKNNPANSHQDEITVATASETHELDFIFEAAEAPL